jgi:hypothetical protein
MSPNRIVALLTPVCALAAGWAASFIAQNFPDANISKESLQAVFIGGMAAVIAPAWQWMHGWQKYEARQSEAEQLALVSDAALGTAAAQPDGSLEDEDDLDLLSDEDELDIDDLAELDDFEELEDDFAADEQEPVATGT